MEWNFWKKYLLIQLSWHLQSDASHDLQLREVRISGEEEMRGLTVNIHVAFSISSALALTYLWLKVLPSCMSTL